MNAIIPRGVCQVCGAKCSASKHNPDATYCHKHNPLAKRKKLEQNRVYLQSDKGKQAIKNYLDKHKN